MTATFPDVSHLRGNFAPLLLEADAHDLVIEGEVPAGLSGSLYRNGPNPQYPPRGQSHWFGGEGMVHAFHIRDGRVSYRNRWVMTDKIRLEREAGRALFGIFNNPMDTDPSVQDKDPSLANTHIVWHAGKLLALEEGHAPVTMAPRSLETEGPWDFGGVLKANFTAHPKVDPETGEMLAFAYMAAGPASPDMAYYVIDRDGKLVRQDIFQAPYSAMVHDFLATDRHVLFPVFPLTASLERAMQGRPFFAWEPEKGSHIGIMARNAGVDSIRWFQAPACYVFHPLNAWSEGDRVIADVMKYDVAPLFPAPDGTPASGRDNPTRLVRWTFDLAGNSDSFKEEALDDQYAEFPRLDERRAGLSYRYGFAAGRSAITGPDGDNSFDTLLRYDLTGGSKDSFVMPEDQKLSEPVFVPRDADAGEGEGWLLATAYRPRENRSDLVIFDAQAVGDGPVARAHLPVRVPYGFHGCWRPDE
ncbi:carotenoid oxygenase family protein [Marinibaculum pumilum]|uniref:Dioxygenase n=1 Tax=Marinibaculum pumilum TaxID=1766165 RepID=A0ABV7L3A4_9PROT